MIRGILGSAAMAGLVLCLWGCLGELNPALPANPLTATGGDDQPTTVDQTVTLTASAGGGVPPYVFRWSIDSVPDDPEDDLDGQIPELPNPTSAEITTLPFEQGRYVYRLMVTDAAGTTALDFVTLTVGPEPLRATIPEEGEDGTVLEVTASEPFTLTVETNLEGDYDYEWRRQSGVEVDFEPADETETTVTITEPGEAVIRIVVIDNEIGRSATQELTLNAVQGDAFLAEIEKPEITRTGSAATLTANITNESIDEGDLTYAWELVKEADATITPTDTRSVRLTGNSPETVYVRVRVSGVINGRLRAATKEIGVVFVADDRPRVTMIVASAAEGVSGEIVFELLADDAPGTVANLLQYIDERFYDGILWHRISNGPDDMPFVVQCGGFVRQGDQLAKKEPTRDPIPSEADGTHSNTRGTIAMALLGGDSDSATTQFFINRDDNAFLDAQDFTVFGSVVEGDAIVRAMSDVETEGVDLVDGGTLFEVPVDDITVVTFRRVDGVSSRPTTGGSDDGGRK